ncbi:excalibur calcium-binding domain-containing protein [Luteimonas sp. BDR2-5]|uniref:excalibur calcium-binding domain-containing protein n=1 Tax=Proluteimonas luteida TaxID=2878685 RepID=UPI0031C10CB9|nr:excalibur calcium-binding domain-containing protein [Luteimonas sp. BDR2-5]
MNHRLEPEYAYTWRILRWVPAGSSVGAGLSLIVVNGRARRNPPAPPPECTAGALACHGPHLDRDNDGIGCEPYRGR